MYLVDPKDVWKSLEHFNGFDTFESEDNIGTGVWVSKAGLVSNSAMTNRVTTAITNTSWHWITMSKKVENERYLVYN